MKISNRIKFSGKKIYLVYVLTLFLSFFFVANFCLAAFLKNNTQDNIENQAIKSAESSYETSSTIYGLIQAIINAFLSVIGVLLLIYMLYAGYNWMTAQGEEEKVEKAKDTLKRAVIGAIIIVAAYAISIFVMSKLEAGTLKGGVSSSVSTEASANSSVS